MTMISELTSTHKTETISCIHSFKMACLQVMIQGHVLKSKLNEGINSVSDLIAYFLYLLLEPFGPSDTQASTDANI
jgi:hypothetical protein